MIKIKKGLIEVGNQSCYTREIKEKGDKMNRWVKKTGVIGLVLLLLVGTVYGLTNEERYAGNQLKVLGILKGYPDGSLKLDASIKRAEVAALTVRMLGYESKAVSGESHIFTDVHQDYWGNLVIQKAYNLKIIHGYPDNSFKPLGEITYAEVVAIMVNALEAQENLEGNWPDNYIEKGKEIGVIPKASHTPANKVVTRGEMAVIIWDTLLVK